MKIQKVNNKQNIVSFWPLNNKGENMKLRLLLTTIGLVDSTSPVLPITAIWKWRDSDFSCLEN